MTNRFHGADIDQGHEFDEMDRRNRAAERAKAAAGPTYEERRRKLLELAGSTRLSKPPEPEFQPGCTKKVRYNSEADARRATRRMRRKLEAYRCVHCGGWHHTDGRGKRR